MVEELLTKGISSLIIIAIAVALAMFWITMLIDCTSRSFKSPRHKILWILCIALLQAIGAFIYWIAVRRKA